MTSAAAVSAPAHCMRCGSPLRAARSVSRGRGRWCQAKVRAAAESTDLSVFTAEQVDKAREVIELGAIVPTSRDGVYLAISSDGTTVYLVNAAAQTCGCKAGEHKRLCYHLAAGAGPGGRCAGAGGGVTVDLIVAERAGRICAILAGQPVPSLPFVLTVGRPLVLTDSDPGDDLGYRAERADYDDQEATNPD